MKFLLTPSGIRNASIREALVNLLGKPISDCSALVIPTAAYYFMPDGADIAYRLITATAELGWQSLGVLELTALVDVEEEKWVPRVQETDALIVGGGDPMYLCHWMRQTGLADLLPSLPNSMTYVGISAGSMAVTSSFGENYNDRVVPKVGSECPLGLIDIAFGAHLDHPNMPDNSLANIEAWAAGISVPTYAMDDNSALTVVDGAIDVVSEGHWKLIGA